MTTNIENIVLRDEHQRKLPIKKYLEQYLANPKTTFLEYHYEILDEVHDSTEKEIERLKPP